MEAEGAAGPEAIPGPEELNGAAPAPNRARKPRKAAKKRKEAAAAAAIPRARVAGRLFARGFAVNALNPKGTVFLLAVLPQFIDLAAPLAPQYLAVAATLGFTEACVMAGYATLAGRVLARLSGARQVRWMQRCFGALFVAAGVGLALWRRA